MKRGVGSVATLALATFAIGPVVAQGSALAASAPSVSAAGGLHVLAPHRVLDTVAGLHVHKGSLKANALVTVNLATTAGVPAGATAALVAVTVTGATKAGFISIGATKSTLSTAESFVKGSPVSQLVPVALSPTATFVFRSSASGVSLRLTVEGYTTSDGTGGSYHSSTGGVGTAAAAAAAGPATKYTVAGGHALTLAVPLASVIPTNTAAAVIAVRALSTPGAGLLSVGKSKTTAAPVLAFAAGGQAAGSVVTALAGGNKITVVNGSLLPVVFQLVNEGYYTPVGGVLYRSISPTALARVTLHAHHATTVAAGSLVPTGSSDAVLSVVVRSPAASGSLKIGASSAAALGSVVFTKHVSSVNTVVSEVTSTGGVVLTSSLSTTLSVQITVLGYFQPVGAAVVPPVVGGPVTTVPVLPPTSGPLNAGALTLQNLDAFPADNRMVFSRIQTPDTSHPPIVETVHDTGILRVLNTGTAASTVSALQLTGPYQLVSAPVVPFSIAAGGHVDLTVKFVATSGRVSYGSLAIGSNAGTNGRPVVTLAGFWQNLSEHLEEPTPQELSAMMGWTTNVPASINDHGHVQADGDEVLSTYWKRADTTKQVLVRQIDAYHSFPQAVSLNWFEQTPAHTLHGIVSTSEQYSQSVLPLRADLVTPAGAYFAPTTAIFGFNVDGTAGEYSDDSLNLQSDDMSNGCTAPCGHHMRFFPVKDASGVLVPNTYYMTMDYSGSAANYDYNDNGYYITNITPAA